MNTDLDHRSRENHLVRYFDSEAAMIRERALSGVFGQISCGLVAIPVLLVIFGVVLFSLPATGELESFRTMVKAHPILAIIFGAIGSFYTGYDLAGEVNESRLRKAERRAMDLEWKASVIKNLLEINNAAQKTSIS